MIKKLHRRSIVRMRRKLKRFQKKFYAGVMTCADVYQSWQSWRAYASNFNAYRSIRKIGALYDWLFLYAPPPEAPA